MNLQGISIWYQNEDHSREDNLKFVQEVQISRSMLQVFSRTEKMSSKGLKIEYDLEGTTKFLQWNILIEEILDDNGIL